MSLNISKLSSFQSWTRASSGYNTAQSLNTSSPLTFNCTNFPAGVYSVGDWIQIETEYMQITAVNDVANTLTVTRPEPVVHATNKVIFFAGVGNQTEPILIGDHISNQTRSGEATIVDIVNDGFTTDTGVRTLKFLILSGSFQTGDHIHCSWGGSFDLGKVTPTSTTENTILVNGTMSDASSGSTISEDLDISETEIDVSLFSNIPVGKFIRVDSEYMLVEDIVDASPDTILVKRGCVGSVSATHSSGATIYIVDDNLFEQILDADVAGSWGLSTISNGRIQLNCHLMLGRTDNAAISVLISANENVDNKQSASNMVWGLGNLNYRTNFCSGRGNFDAGSRIFTGLSFAGSVLNFNNIETYPYSSFLTYASTINSNLKTLGSLFMRETNIYGNLELFNTNAESGKVYYVNQYGGYFNPATSVVEISKLYNHNKNNATVYWVYSLGDAEFWEFETEDGYDWTEGFIASGNKVFVNCKCGMAHDTFWGSEIFIHKKTFDVNVKNEDGDVVEGAVIVADYVGGANICEVSTNVDGNIEQQQIQFYYYETNSSSPVETRDIQFYVRCDGYEDSPIELITIGNRDNPIVRNITLKRITDLVDDDGNYYIANPTNRDLIKDDGKSIMEI